MNSQLSLYELNQLISNTLKTQLSGFYWVVAEINNINESRQGHCYLELIEKDKDTDNIKASIRGSIWASKYRFIKPYFENITGKSLETSMKILLKVSVEFHPMYGLSLIVNDIDANYTLGDLHRKRQEVINLLVSQGVIDMNKMLEIPEVIQNIAVISSQGAAGYGDFVEQLSSNPYSYKYKIALYNAIMQGVKTEKSIIEALNHIYHEKFKPDVVVIIRGGGAKTDLVAFDSYNIAFHITQFPIPIFTGIGHERDESIADMVSHSRFKTPTAVAAHINEHNRSFENEITEIYDSIVEHTKIHIKNHFSMINYFAIEMVNNSREKIAEAIYATDKYLVSLNNISQKNIRNQSFKLKSISQTLNNQVLFNISKHKAQLENISNEIKSKPNRIINSQIKHLSLLENNVEMANPVSILKRGFSISRLNGKLINSSKLLEKGEIIETEFYDGIVKSKVENIENRKTKQ